MLSCSCDYDGSGDWWWQLAPKFDFQPLDTKRSRKCCSCKKRIEVGDDCVVVDRFRDPSDRCNYIEESIYGTEVPLADWHLCEVCGGLMMSIDALGFCCTLGGQSLKSQIAEYNAEMDIPVFT